MADEDQAVGTMHLLRPSPDKCQLCAIDHEPGWPHNAQSLYYQMRFQMQHGRGGTWADAIAHCGEDMQQAWRSKLQALGAWTEPKRGVEVIAEPIENPSGAD